MPFRLPASFSDFMKHLPQLHHSSDDHDVDDEDGDDEDGDDEDGDDSASQPASSSVMELVRNRFERH